METEQKMKKRGMSQNVEAGGWCLKWSIVLSLGEVLSIPGW